MAAILHAIDLKTAIFPTSPGIGDLIWHLPFIRAIAKATPGGQVTVIARSSTLAKEWLVPDPAVLEVLYHHRRRRRRENRILEGEASGAAEDSFIREIKRREFQRVFLFSDRVKPVIHLWRAGIPLRAGYGHRTLQRLFLNTPPFIEPYRGPLAPRLFFDAAALSRAHGFTTDAPPPRIHIPQETLERFAGAFSDLGAQWMVAFGLGASADRKSWGAQRFSALAETLTTRGHGVLALGGPAEADLVANLKARLSERARPRVRCVISRSVLESAAMIRQCDCMVGNDTGMLNVAAAAGVRSLGLFGATTPLSHDPEMQAIQANGMAAISTAEVVAKLEGLGWLSAPDPGS